MARPRLLSSLLLLSLPFLGACGSGESETPGTSAVTDADGSTGMDGNEAPDGEEIMDHDETMDDLIPMVKYTWDNTVGDASVSAQMGGPGFTGEGWTTNMEFQAIGSADAIKGGSLKRYLTDWPATLRQHGKDWNSSLNYLVADLCYETLLGSHPISQEPMPAIASHWKISEDKSLYTYRINPAARWSDGTEITSADVIASYDLRLDPKALDPSSAATYGKMDRPVAISKYIVEVKCSTPNWRNFLYFSGMGLFPAAEVSIPGDEYLDKFQNAYTASSGPYIVKPESIEMGTGITLTRRDDWWDKNNPAWVGLYNIDNYEYEVVMDAGLAFEKVKKGEIDYYLVPRAQWWAEDLKDVEAVKRGLLVMCKYYTDAPVGTSGVAINSQRPPLDDLRMRQVLQYLYNRELFIDKLYYNEYSALQSYWQGGSYMNKENKVLPYDPFEAVLLLEEMGYTEKNSDGYLTKDGQVLRFNLTYSSKFSEPNLTIYQEDAKAAGIELVLTFETPASRWKSMRQKQYDLTSTAWGALVNPNPETSFGGALADQFDNNNVTSYSNARVDELCVAYDNEYDVQRRREIIREIDGIIYKDQPYVLGWFNPAQRMVYWNRYSMPAWGATKTADYDSLHYTWWVDPVKEAALEAAMKDPSITLDPGPTENRFWQEWNKSH
ncbi:MAG: microcin C transport system substrate-binding protein [Bacteroidia bacterium]|jgi:microcin C transport system substrate-binding protein